uniref:phosphatidate phosphatase n=1 Tax=Anopheles atroparvus TaxID=41427 RepID=A0A182ISQ9_ANOAO
MNSLVSLFSNVKEFYSEINGATLTGAIDVVVVEQPDGSFVSSPFHVRFGKLGVLRSREKVVDIEVNGEPVELQMKLGESGEAFFVEECAEDDIEVPAHMATSPIPTHSYLTNYEGSNNQGSCGPKADAHGGGSLVVGPVDAGEGASMMVMVTSPGAARENEGAVGAEEDVMPRPRRNSVDLSNENAETERVKYENQRSEYGHRRHTDNVTNRPDLSLTKKEYTMQKLRQEWVAAAEAAEQEQIFHMEGLDDDAAVDQGGDWKNSTPLPAGGGGNQASEDKHFKPIDAQPTTTGTTAELLPVAASTSSTSQQAAAADALGDSKSKKKRRKKSLMKKKNTQRKSSTSSSSGGGSNHSDPNEGTETSDSLTASQVSGGTPKDAYDENASLTGPSAKEKESSIKEGRETPEPSAGASVAVPLMSSSHHAELDVHFFSDTDVGLGASPQQSRPSTPIQSDTEFEMSLREKPVTEEQKLLYGEAWNWGELPTTQSEAKAGGDPDGGKQAQHNSMLNGLMSLMKYNNKKKRQSVPDGLYLSDLDKVMEPEIAKLYFPALPLRKPKKDQGEQRGDGGSGEDEDRESGNGTSIPQSPTSMEDGPGGMMLKEGTDSDFDEHHHHQQQRRSKASEVDLAGQSIETIAISLCGGLDTPEGPSEEQFERARLQYTNVLADPSVFGSPDLVVRINGKFYSWAVACPQVMTMLAFQKALPTELLDSKKGGTGADDVDVESKKPQEQQLQQQEQQAQQPQQTVGGRWWYWRRSNESKPAPSSIGPPLTPSTPTAANELGMDGVDSSKTSAAVATQTSRSNSPEDESNAGASAAMDTSVFKATSKAEDGYNGSLSSEDSELVMEKSHHQMMDNSTDKVLSLLGEKYRKTLRLSSERIRELNLQDGINEIEFSVTTAYQGTTRCKCYLFKWKHNDKVVISDIDGTITKSDVLGHILPMVGKSWDQIGVAQLFSKIEENGYKMLYLSARAIGQARTTRGYLQSIRQGDVKLPDGPLLLNPTSLMSAFHREVIEKKPEQFKIACLNDIRDLFPEKNPFYAGYGNRINDVWAYRAVGIPTSRIFTINPKGELKHELTQTFQSTYANMAYIVDQLYPPIKHIEEEDNEYTSFNYWREPVPEIDFNTCDISGSSIAQSPASPSATSEKLSPTAATILQQALPTIPEN